MRRDDGVDVLLEEESRGAARVAGRRVSVAGWASLLAIVLVVVVLVDARRSAATAQRLGGAVSLSVVLGDPLRVAWSAPAGSVLGAAGEVLVTVTADGTVRGLRLEDGTEAWAVPVPAGAATCWVAELPVCAGTGGAGRAVVVALEPASGAVRHRLDWVTGAAVVGEVGGDVVLVGGSSRGRVVAERWSPGTGRAAWTYRSEPGVLQPQQTAWEEGDGWVRVRSHGEVVVSLDTGTELAAAPADRRVAVVPAGDAAARDLTLAVRDGGLSRLAPDGSVAWTYRFATSGGTEPTPLLTVAGVLVCAVGGTVVALDQDDGSVLWTSPTGLTQAVTAATDGWWVAHTLRDEAGTALVVRDPRDGAVVRRVGLPDSPVARLTVLPEGSLVVATTDAVQVLR